MRPFPACASASPARAWLSSCIGASQRAQKAAALTEGHLPAPLSSWEPSRPRYRIARDASQRWTMPLPAGAAPDRGNRLGRFLFAPGAQVGETAGGGFSLPEKRSAQMERLDGSPDCKPRDLGQLAPDGRKAPNR